MNRWKAVRLVIGAIGLVMVAVALASALPGLPGMVELSVLILGGVLSAAAILGSRTGAAYRSAGVVVLNTVLLLVVLELSANGLLQVISRSRTAQASNAPPPNQTIPKNSPFYQKHDWATQFWAEFEDSVWTNTWYHPHEMWRRRPFSGQHTNIGPDGLRITPGASCQSGAVVVYTFGGSTIWGYGVPDWGTIPAYLQAHWSRTMARPVCVVNFGQLGHSSTQGLIALQRKLQRCEIPDAVIFYDGVNDTRYGQIFGTPGGHHALRETAEKLDTDVLTPPAPSWRDKLNIIRLVRAFRPKDPPRVHRYEEHPGSIAADVGPGIAEVYLNNVRIVSALAREYGFVRFAFWQPWIYVGNKPLTEAEQRIRGGPDEMGAPDRIVKESPAQRLYRQVYNLVGRGARSNDQLHDFSDIFDTVSSLTYIDSGHLTTDGNQLVARRILQVIGDEIPNPDAERSARECRVTSAGP